MRSSSQCRALLFGLALASLGASAAQANVLINVNKNTQTMTVSVDGVPRYHFNVSTGRAGYGTPDGTFHPIRLEKTWFSKEYYNSPMPHSIFFKGGYAIHGSYEINRLGGPASHGCVRLHPKNAAALFALVKAEGMDKTTIVVSGQNPSPLIARRRAAPETETAQDLAPTPTYGRRYQPYDDGYDNRQGGYYQRRYDQGDYQRGYYDNRRGGYYDSGRNGFSPFTPHGYY